MQKVRSTVPGPLPDGPLKKGEVLLAPKRSRWVFLKYLTTARVLRHAGRATAGRCKDLLFCRDLSVGVRMQRIKAELMTACTANLYDPETLYKAGFRRAKCVCSPGFGHRAPRPHRKQASRRKSRRN